MNIPLVSLIFLRPLVSPILLFYSISLHWSVRKAFLSFLASLWNSACKWLYLSFSPLPLFFQLGIISCSCPKSWVSPDPAGPDKGLAWGRTATPSLSRVWAHWWVCLGSGGELLNKASEEEEKLVLRKPTWSGTKVSNAVKENQK